MKIVDNFLFHNEYDTLELRFKQHYDYVDKFVIAECDHTFTGIYKGFNLEQQKDRFAPWWDKVCYLKLTDPPKGNTWHAEHWQRDCFNRGWGELGDNDVVIIADVDEMLRPETFNYIRSTDYACYGLCLPMFYYRFNYLNLNGHYPWEIRAFRGYYPNGSYLRNNSHIPGRSKISLHHAGWHFSWLGNNETVIDKLRSFSHTEYNIPEIIDNLNIEQSVANGKDHMGRDHLEWKAVKVDEYFPQIIRENLEKYQHLIAPGGEQTVQEFWKYGILEERIEQ